MTSVPSPNPSLFLNLSSSLECVFACAHFLCVAKWLSAYEGCECQYVWVIFSYYSYLNRSSRHSLVNDSSRQPFPRGENPGPWIYQRFLCHLAITCCVWYILGKHGAVKKGWSRPVVSGCGLSAARSPLYSNSLPSFSLSPRRFLSPSQIGAKTGEHWHFFFFFAGCVTSSPPLFVFLRAVFSLLFRHPSGERRGEGRGRVWLVSAFNLTVSTLRVFSPHAAVFHESCGLCMYWRSSGR